jgi:subtilase family serine protease
MRRRHGAVALTTAGFMVTALLAAGGAVAGSAVAGAGAAAAVRPTYHTACSATPRAGFAACAALLPTVQPNATGYGPSQLASAYALAAAQTNGGKGQTVALVDAYSDPNAQKDLDTYRSKYGLPACDAGCFEQVSQTGSTTNLPPVDASQGWQVEEMLDIEMTSAICPNCHILLVVANSPSTANLGAAVNEAAKLGATEISNSYGGPTAKSDNAISKKYYDHPGIAITASSGDSGYGAGFPAASDYVTAVGGTTLKKGSGSRGWTETAWSGAGAGCSTHDTKETWQQANTIIKGACPTGRAIADVSADANPSTGVEMYDSLNSGGVAPTGWFVVGGTSVASPIIAAVYALAGNAATVKYGSYPYTHTSGLNDITSGNDGTCSKKPLCTAGKGWDGPTGLGTPKGVTGF